MSPIQIIEQVAEKHGLSVRSMLERSHLVRARNEAIYRLTKETALDEYDIGVIFGIWHGLEPTSPRSTRPRKKRAATLAKPKEE